MSLVGLFSTEDCIKQTAAQVLKQLADDDKNKDAIREAIDTLIFRWNRAVFYQTTYLPNHQHREFHIWAKSSSTQFRKVASSNHMEIFRKFATPGGTQETSNTARPGGSNGSYACCPPRTSKSSCQRSARSRVSRWTTTTRTRSVSCRCLRLSAICLVLTCHQSCLLSRYFLNGMLTDIVNVMDSISMEYLIFFVKG